MDDISEENNWVLIPEYISDKDVRVSAAHDFSFHHSTQYGIHSL